MSTAEQTTCTRCGQKSFADTYAGLCFPCDRAARNFFAGHGKMPSYWHEGVKQRQAKLFTGMDCLPGQLNLFEGIDGAT